MTVTEGDRLRARGIRPIPACAAGRQPLHVIGNYAFNRLDERHEPPEGEGCPSDHDVATAESRGQELTSRQQKVLDERVCRLEKEVDQLRCAMANRAPIEQAKGILMLLNAVDDQVAFDMLVYVSSHTHKKIRDVAIAIRDAAAGNGDVPMDIQRTLRTAWPPAGRSSATAPRQ